MNFEDFARAHGLILNHVIAGKWMAVPTEDHPRKRNGRYKFMGDIGWVQNWATMTKPEMWRSEGTKTPAFDATRIRVLADQQRAQEARRASEKAEWIMSQTELTTHPYLAHKGFKDEKAVVWNGSLVVPMRLKGRLVGCQLINEEGEKKFLRGQQTKGASFVLDAHGIPVLCEGYATALSVRAALKAAKIRHTIHVCFSAGNIETVASRVPGGIIVADRDLNGVGERAANNTGKPYWLSDTVGEDFNDFHLRVGLFQASLSLKRFVAENANDSIAV